MWSKMAPKLEISLLRKATCLFLVFWTFPLNEKRCFFSRLGRPDDCECGSLRQLLLEFARCLCKDHLSLSSCGAVVVLFSFLLTYCFIRLCVCIFFLFLSLCVHTLNKYTLVSEFTIKIEKKPFCIVFQIKGSLL